MTKLPSLSIVQERLLAAILAERTRQDQIFGKQSLPSVDPVLTNRIGGTTAGRMAAEYEIPTVTRAKFLCNAAFERNQGNWAVLAVEELAEAVEAATVYGEHSTQLYEELIQTTAVLLAWLEDLEPNEIR